MVQLFRKILRIYRVTPWFRDKGDITLRLDYDLNQNSIVFDLGGYEGQWSNDIFVKYGCSIHVFEPVEEFAKKIQERFKDNPKITVYPFGLAAQDKIVRIGIHADSSSAFKTSTSFVDGKMRCAADFCKKNNFRIIDLMKINIEGGEYELLTHLLDCGLTKTIQNIQVQFHDFLPNAARWMAEIQKRLKETHFLTYQYPYVWENWQRIK